MKRSAVQLKRCPASFAERSRTSIPVTSLRSAPAGSTSGGVWSRCVGRTTTSSIGSAGRGSAKSTQRPQRSLRRSDGSSSKLMESFGSTTKRRKEVKDEIFSVVVGAFVVTAIAGIAISGKLSDRGNKILGLFLILLSGYGIGHLLSYLARLI